jgi:glycosyltransferase involved in cell wall biosynthesis
MKNYKLIRITTVPQSLKGLLQGQLRFMIDFFEVIGISSPGERLEEVKTQERVKVIPVTMSRQITPFKDLKALWQLYSIFKKEKPQIVHTHTPKAGTLGMFAAKLAGVPIRLHTVAGLPLMEARGNKRKLLDAVEKLTYRCSTKVFPNSKGLYDFILKQKYTKPVKLKVLAQGSSNGIDTTHFNPSNVSDETKQDLKQDLYIQSKDFVYVFIGRLVKDKGITELVSAFKNLNIDKPNTKLVLVGSYEADLDPLYPETIEEININNNIITVGYQSDVRPYLAISDVLVFPSYREGFPNVVMQAGAMGLPSIVTDINGCNEIIQQGVNGLIIPAKNVERLQDAMSQILENAVVRLTLHNNARSLICERYERSKVWNAILMEYNVLIKEQNL